MFSKCFFDDNVQSYVKLFLTFSPCLFPLLYLVDDMMGDFAILPHTQYIVPQNDVGNNGDIDNHEAANNVDLPVGGAVLPDLLHHQLPWPSHHAQQAAVWVRRVVVQPLKQNLYIHNETPEILW